MPWKSELQLSEAFVDQSVIWKNCWVCLLVSFWSPSREWCQHGLGLSVSYHESATSDTCDCPTAKTSLPPMKSYLLFACNSLPFLSHSHPTICGMKQLLYVKKEKEISSRRGKSLKTCSSPWLSSKLNPEAVALAQRGGVAQQRGSEKPSGEHCDKIVATKCLKWWNYGSHSSPVAPGK